MALAVIVPSAVYIFKGDERPGNRVYEVDPSLIPGAMYEDAGKMSRQGEYGKARRLYKKIISRYPETEFAPKAKEAMDKLSMEMLFSAEGDYGKTAYTVQPGDSLSKIAKRFGVTVELIKVCNGLTGDLIRPGMSLKIVDAEFSILVDKSQNILMLKADGEVIKTYEVSTGADGCTPEGTFKIINKLADPTWFSAGAVVPPGSQDNLLGSRWLGIDVPGYGIHGTNDESTIGMHITQGCVRMRNSEVEELYSIIPVKTLVTIID